jgi:EmrB/QacA subfamily drug resistance transporter
MSTAAVAGTGTRRNPRRWWILGVLCLSLLVLVVDNTVLNVAIPTLIRDLGASSSDIQWVLDAYILVFAGLLLTAGGLSDRYGRRRGLVIGLVVFGAASFAATLASTPGELIAARAVMGVGGAFLMPGTLSILTTVFDDGERKKAIAIWSTVLMLGAAGGPTLGGLLLQHFWWGSVFLLNVPIAALGILAAVLIIPESRGHAGKLDPVGALLSTAGMTALVWAIIQVSRDGWRGGPGIAFGAAAVVLVGFGWWELRSPAPMLPMELFRNRNFAGASFSIVLLSFGAGGVLLALTQYLQFVQGYSPLRAGTALVPLLVATMVFNGIGVQVDRKLGTRAAVGIGFGLLAAGFGLLATTHAGDGYGRVALALVVLGAGSGTCGPAVYGTLLGSLPTERAGVGSAVNDTIQQLGQALSVAVLGSVLTAVFSHAMPAGLPGQVRRSVGQALAVAGATGDAGLAETARTAFVHAMSVASWIGALGGVAAGILAVTVLRPDAAGAAGAPSLDAVAAGPEPAVIPGPEQEHARA